MSDREAGPRVPPEPPDAMIVTPDAPPATTGQPDEVIIRLAPADPAISSRLNEQLDRYAPAAARVPAVRRSTGLAALDRALEVLGAGPLYRVGGAAGQIGVADAGQSADDPLADHFVVVLPAGQDVYAAVELLAETPGVAQATPHGTFTVAATVLDDPLLLAQWGLLHIRAPQAWDITHGLPGTAVAVVDSGCDLTHPDLAGRLGTGWNALSPDQPPQDEQGHGTHVAGIIAAAGNNATDVAGVAWGCTVLPVKVLDATGHSVGVSVAQGIVWAARTARIINCSLQGPVDDLAMRTAIEYARGLGVLVVTAMGNFGWGEDQPSYPAAYARDLDNVLAVGAVDRAHRRSVWSSTGSSNTGSWIGVVAPGTNIVSLKLGGGTVDKSGTSMACPHVSGAAALLRSQAPQLSPAQVIAVLRSSAGSLRDLVTDPVPNPSYGSGLIDAASALAALAPRHNR